MRNSVWASAFSSALLLGCGNSDTATNHATPASDPADGGPTSGADDDSAAEDDDVAADDVVADDDNSLAPPDEASEPGGQDDDNPDDPSAEPVGGSPTGAPSEDPTTEGPADDGGTSQGPTATGGSPGTVPEPTSPPGDDALATSAGCAGVYNPDQVLEFDLELSPNDWASLLADETYSLDFQAQLSCNGEPPLVVGVQRKRSGGAEKVGFKVDTNLYVDDQEFQGLRKMVFENGVSSGSSVDDAEVSVLVSEYLGWRVMGLSGAISSHAAIASMRVNGGPPLAYVNVENVDKRFLDDRLGDDDGWLYKKSGGDGDGLKTHETDGLENPHAAYFCFWEGRGTGCASPPADELSSGLPPRLDIAQMLRFGAVNALMGNTDSPLLKDNNYFYYDSTGGVRTYLPWDLDTTMRTGFHVVTGSVPGGSPLFTDVLFSHWQDDYVAILQQIVAERVTLDAITSELDRVAAVAGSTLDGDPYLADDTESAVAALERWWAARLPAVAEQIDL